MTYIGRHQSTVAQWVDLPPLFEVCTREKGYKGVGRRKETWWHQEATEKQLWATMIGILQEAKRRRRFGENVTQYEP